jgi:AhpD family alkylhydroperoxidase
MPRLRYIDEAEKTARDRETIESARRTGAPDPRVVSIMLRNPKTGAAWVEYWNTLLYHGVLPHKLKEMCRIKISVAHQCGYCSTVRSHVAKAEGLTEDLVTQLLDYESSTQFSAREKAALRYADAFKKVSTRSTPTKFSHNCTSTSPMKRSSSSGCSAPRPMGSASSCGH